MDKGPTMLVPCCGDCGGEMIPFYGDDQRVSRIPAYCETCRALWIDGKKIDLPKEALKEIKSVSDQAKEASEKASEEIHRDPKVRVRKYFEGVFNWAFAEGFLRAYMFFKHKTREGRLKRIREIWDKGSVDEYKGTFRAESIADLRELSRLIRWKL